MPVSSPESVIQFGLFQLDVKAGQLRQSGNRIRLAQQPVQVLTILLERAGEVVTREELQKRLWSPDVFVDFDHGLNKSIQKLRDALGDSAESPRYIETIPRVGYRFIAPVNAEPKAVTEENEPHETDEPARGTKLPWILVAGCVLLLATWAGWLMYGRFKNRAQARPIHSLAVLPLENLSGDKEQDYFADGMTDELTTMLAKDSRLRIMSRTSAMQYKGVHKSLPEIARELGVDGIVEGSVERSGDDVHMTLQLIQGTSDTHVWADSYDRDATDAISLPDEAAMAIAKTTDSATAEHKPARYVNPRAHDAYLHGRYLWFAGRNDEAEAYFQKAIQLQPDYAPAWSGVADYYLGGMALGQIDPRVARGPSMEAANKAVALDDTLAQAHLSLCAAVFFNEWDWVKADRQCVRAIELDPEFAEAYHFRAKIFAATGRSEEAVAMQKKAMELDPFSRSWGLAFIYLLARQYDAGITEAKQRLESNPHDATTYFVLSGLYRGKGMSAEAVKAQEHELIEAGDAKGADDLQHAFARGGYRAVLRWNLADLDRKTKNGYVSPVAIALQYAQLGDGRKALEFLEQACKEHSPELIDGALNDSAYDFLHSDPQYRLLIQQIGLPREY